jgi:hypothetical protein
MEKDNKRDNKQVGTQSKEDKEINDSDYHHRQADFEDEGDEEISGED